MEPRVKHSVPGLSAWSYLSLVGSREKYPGDGEVEEEGSWQSGTSFPGLWVQTQEESLSIFAWGPGDAVVLSLGA